MPIEWIREYLETNATDDQIVETLESVGFEIEASDGGATLDDGIVVSEILAVKKHPNADKLRLARVTDGKDEYDIVCGAPNIKKGQRVPLARVDTVMPDGTQIKKSKIRGEESDGMLCSAKELQISDDHEGILVLEKDASLGEAFSGLLGGGRGRVVTLKDHANRSDTLSILGLSKEAFTALGVKAARDKAISRSWKVMPVSTLKKFKTSSEDVVVQDADLAPRYILKRYRVQNGESPDWMQRRLAEAGLRPINAVVDITNYVLLELGQPTHAFDATKLGKKVVVRRANAKEKIETLDGKTHELGAEMLVIANATKPIGIAGVMGGRNTEVDEKTTEIALEAATFDAVSVRKTAQALGIRTEASARFERGLPVQLAEFALMRVEKLLIEICKAKPVDQGVDLLSVWPWVQHIGLRRSRISRLLGYDVPHAAVLQILRDLECEVEEFDIVAEARKHLGKPYKLGANFREDGLEAFDCSYLTDYIYSLIGAWIGHTAQQQFEKGREVSERELRPGDILFYEGKWDKLKKEDRGGVGHNGIYIGDGKVIHASQYEFVAGDWVHRKKSGVIEVPLDEFTKNPGYLGARRYVEDLNDFIAVTTPFWRTDLRREVDLIEEVARFWGFEKIQPTLPEWRGDVATVPSYTLFKRELRQILAGAGLSEVYTYSLVSEKLARAWRNDVNERLRLANPSSVEQSYLREELEPSMLQVIAINRRQRPALSFFEISRVFVPGAGELPTEPERLCVGLWGDGALNRARALLEVLGGRLALGQLSVKQDNLGGLHPERGAYVSVGKERIGQFGEASPRIARPMKVEGAVLLSFELSALYRLSGTARRYEPILRFPAVELDISLEVGQEQPAAVLLNAVREAPLVHDVELLSVFDGAPIPTGKKNVVLRVRYADPAKTLTEAQAQAAQAEVIKRLEEEAAARLR